MRVCVSSPALGSVVLHVHVHVPTFLISRSGPNLTFCFAYTLIFHPFIPNTIYRHVVVVPIFSYDSYNLYVYKNVFVIVQGIC